MPNDMAHDNPLLKAFSAAAALDGTPDWFGEVTRKGSDRFAELGLPTNRTEAWKYTSLRGLGGMTFSALAKEAEAVAIPRERIAGIAGIEIVLVNGRLDESRSALDKLPVGLMVTPLAVALQRKDGVTKHALQDESATEGLPLAALSTAGITGGVLIEVARDADIAKPIHIISIGSGGDAPVAFAPRNVVWIGPNAKATLVESHVGEGGYFSNSVTHVTVEDEAVFHHYKLQNESREAYHVAMTHVHCGEKTIYDNFALSCGAKLARNEIRSKLDGSEILYAVNGVYMAAANQHLDNTTFIEHAKPNSESREIYKGVLDENGRGVFQGKILVQRPAQKTDGYQMNRALLLSRKAEIDSKPELEIYADDVKCSHGATVGELDAEQLFYLKARGINEHDARNMLIEAYLRDALDEIRVDKVALAFGEKISGWLAARIAREEAA
ncbi:Fe-S cluster assembly protein SufD [Nisaea acidiphila]|uniref:Fe-S cluster assembly protein SufD n=1 Tax=Nisaea acidiphila TaxID=1862145 RepID=A0A9J7ATA7_9PROT|nr:Fe-S cluster assembly protein SufD [Nisaea acidiphila]UUX50568.1 Fe-S cluster assembly protein SufD [Nisaea acidiphila]